MKMYRFSLFCRLFFIIFFLSLGIAVANEKLSYVYDESSVNFISSNQINAIVFNVPIAQVNFPPKQLASISYKDNRSVSYVNNNKTILFYLSGGSDYVQFMVALKNGRVLSLHFKADKLKGRVVSIPESMSGRMDVGDGVQSIRIKNNADFDSKIKKIMQSVFFDVNMGDDWIKISEYKNRRYKNIDIERYQKFDNVFYQVEKWVLCSNARNTLLIESKKNNNSKLLAITISRENLLTKQCAKLIALYSKDDEDAI